MAADTHLLLIFALSLFHCPTAFELSFIEHPQYSVALPGDSVYFSCKTNLPSSMENITWLHKGQPLATSSKASSKGHLTFKVSTDPEVYQKQLGSYQCIGGASGSPHRLASLEAELSVAKLGDFRTAKKNETVVAFEGNDMVIPCQVPESIPPAFVQFAKDGLVVDEGHDILNGDTLLLTNVTMNDSGNYSCIVTNHITNERKTSPNAVQLVVEESRNNEKSRLIYSPKDNYQVKQGEDVHIPCTASGVPKPEIVWTKLSLQDDLHMTSLNNDSGLVVDSGVLVITDAKVTSETEHFLCAVFNGARRFVRRTSVTVLAPPKFEATPDKVVVVADQDASLNIRCQASGSPPPRIQWVRNGAPVQGPDHTGQLVIPKVEESGFYQCFATNNVGQVVHDTFVQVGEDSSVDEYDLLEADVEAVKNYEGFAIASPTRPNVTQVSAESVVIMWDLEQPDEQPVIPVKFFKIQFREFYKGKGRSPWHTLDDVIGSDVRAFEILGLLSDRKYRFRVVVVFENDDSKPGPLSRKFKMHANSAGLSPKPRPPSQSPGIVGLLPLGPTSLRVGWALKDDDPENVEGYFIFVKPSLSDEKYKKITILGATSHFYVLEALMPGTEYEIKVQAFNLAGPSPFSEAATQSTVPLPPVSSAEVSEAEQEPAKDLELIEDNEKVLKYLIIGGCLAGSLVVFILICSTVTYCHRRKKANNNLAEINDKYNDTAVQISQSNLQSFADLDSRNQSFLSVTKDNHSSSHFEMTLLGKNQLSSVSDSMFSSRHASQSAEINSLGQEEYNNEPSRMSWRRSRRSEESFI